MTLPKWTRRDELNLHRRIRRLVGERVEAPAPVAPHLVAPARPGCRDCDDDHRHAAVRIGPFVICRCLACPVLVVAR